MLQNINFAFILYQLIQKYPFLLHQFSIDNTYKIIVLLKYKFYEISLFNLNLLNNLSFVNKMQ